jgi:xylulokinase
MNEMITALNEGPTNIVYYPYLSGIGTPLFRSDMSGGFFGLKASHGTADMLKAILEGISYQGKWILSLVPGKQLDKIKDVICVGGAANSSPWMKLKADILGIPITVPKEAEATLLGATAIMIEKLYGTEKRQTFLAEIQKQNQVFKVNHEINERYNEIYSKKYTFLIDMMVKQELGRK